MRSVADWRTDPATNSNNERHRTTTQVPHGKETKKLARRRRKKRERKTSFPPLLGDEFALSAMRAEGPICHLGPGRFESENRYPDDEPEID